MMSFSDEKGIFEKNDAIHGGDGGKSLPTSRNFVNFNFDAQYSQKAVFSLEKGSNGQNHASSMPFSRD